MSGERSLPGLLDHYWSRLRRRLLTHRLIWAGGRGRPRILFICFGLRTLGTTDPIRKETLDLRNAVGKALPGASGLLVSLEEDSIRPSWDARHHALLWPVRDSLSLLERVRPDLVHVVEETVGAYFGLGLDRGSPCPVLLTAAGADPVQLASEELIAALRHATDVQTLTLVMESSGAARQCEEAGLRCGGVIHPAVEPEGDDAPLRDATPFTVGFASSPFSAAAFESRGIPLLLDVAARLPEVRFLLAWREHSPPVEEAVRMRGLGNVEVLRGTHDMTRFYGRTHAVLLPFTGKAGNHACPFSGVEALVRGLPLVVTAEVGLAEAVSRFHVGAVVSPTPSAFAEGICRVRDQWDEMRAQALHVGRKLFSPAVRAQRYGVFYRRLSRIAASPPLQAWEAMTRAAGNPVIRNRADMRAHYETPEIVRNYLAQRFDSPPLLAAEAEERQAVAGIVAEHSRNRETPRALDIASGEGRILRTLLPHVSCIALEPSAAMVRQSQSTIPREARVQFVRADVFALPFRTGSRFDIVTAFRFIRHQLYPERRRLYSTVRQLLQADGLFLADFPNGVVETQLRKRHGWSRYHVYDSFWSAEDVELELWRNGFSLVRLVPVGVALFSDLVPWPEEPLLWVGVFCLASGAGSSGRAVASGLQVPPALSETSLPNSEC